MKDNRYPKAVLIELSRQAVARYNTMNEDNPSNWGGWQGGSPGSPSAVTGTSKRMGADTGAVVVPRLRPTGRSTRAKIARFMSQLNLGKKTDVIVSPTLQQSANKLDVKDTNISQADARGKDIANGSRRRQRQR